MEWKERKEEATGIVEQRNEEKWMGVRQMDV